MVAVWTQALLSAAEISNFFSALGVLICFISMVVYIMRIQGIQFTSSSVVHVGQPSPVQVNFKKIGIPFVCFLNSDKCSSEEIEFRLTIDVTCYLQVFWGVSSTHLKDLIYMSWNDFSEKLEDFNGLHAKKVDDKILLEPEQPNETRIVRFTKEKDFVSLGKAPRTHFPLVIILTRKDLPFDTQSNVGSLICVAHISDDDCPMPSSIIYQYLKQYSGQLTQLQTLYTQRKEPNLDDRKWTEDKNVSSPLESPFDNELSEDGACVICRVMQPTRALLPCRHVCVCSFCFAHLEFCPLCRSRISAFFLTDPAEEERQNRLEQNDISCENSNSLNRHRSFLSNMNGVLNSVLGLRD